MMLTDDRVSHLAHLIKDKIWNDDLVDFTEEAAVLREIKRVFTKYFAAADEIDTIVRQKIYSQKKSIPEGSRDWDILYRKYFEEELAKRGVS